MRKIGDAGAERIILYGFRSLPNSAFSDFSSAQPNDPQSKVLRDAASAINRSRKFDYIGKKILGVAAEPSWKMHGYTMVYPGCQEIKRKSSSSCQYGAQSVAVRQVR